jgi:ribosomal protein S18 acetylase RimI-like enzyme
MSGAIQIRPLEPRDREAVRRICIATADRGRASGELYPDDELAADLLTTYFTDVDPGWSWVAEADGQVVGYVTAADNRRFRRAFIWRIIPRAVCRAIGRGALWHKTTWQLGWGALRAWVRGTARWPKTPRDYPAHLHIDILGDHRGQHVGRRLMEACLDTLRKAGSAGVTAPVRADNPAACAFFDRMGFQVLGHYTIGLPLKGQVELVQVQIYGKRTAP